MPSLAREALEQLAGFVERQPHDAGIAAPQIRDEAGRAPLDRVSARLVVALARGDVLADLVLRERLERHLGNRQRALYPVAVLERHRGEHLVAAPGKASQHPGGVLAVR